MLSLLIAPVTATVSFYLCAWLCCFVFGRGDPNGIHLPLNPTRVFKVNKALFQLVTGWVAYMPLIISYLYWRYWQVGWKSDIDSVVRLDVPFNESSSLDVFYPSKKQDGLSPIIVFIYGGGWGSGTKKMYSTLANTLRQLGYVVVVPDYRKYPEAYIDNIYKDVREAIQWTYNHASEIKGDPKQIYLMGHSAGAHLVCQVALSDIIENSSGDRLPPIQGLLLFSGVYNIASHLIHETFRGIEKLSVMARVMGSTQKDFDTNSPIYLIERNADLVARSEKLSHLWPRILLWHGEDDATVPMDQSVKMYHTLKKALPSTLDIRLELHKGIGHGEPVIGLMSNLFASNQVQKLLIKNIQDFIDT